MKGIETIMKNKELLMEKAMTFAGNVQQNKYLKAISYGLMATLPLLIIGSIALLLMVLPIAPWQNFITSTGIAPYFNVAFTLTTSLIALYSSFTIAYKLAEYLDENQLTPAFISTLCFLMVVPLANVDGASFLDIGWLGAKGLFTALVVALLSCRLYCYLVGNKKITIKMPESVPPVVSNTFAGLIPSLIVAAVFLIVAMLFGATSYGSFAAFIYNVIALPLQNLTGSVWSLLLIVIVQMVLWFFGLHGSIVVGAFITALYLPMDTANMEAAASGVANGELPNILGKTFYDIFAGIGGAGGTLSLVILMLILAKSKQIKTLGKIAIGPGMFTINEPVIFGLPLVLNPIMAIPFISVPLIQVLVAYGAIATGIVPKLTGVQVPFGMPIFVNGFLAGGWQIAILQVVLVVIGMVIYFPFIKMMDKNAVKVEMQDEKQNMA
ncbi:PTS system oligo-beta-mannoside-specific EIIC component [Mycobacteroides abscessus subsp. abscessus]|nr:PTS system oligo-beta-mannoside-specific EIIC component [Mycobacteroides abscessus subsp. abscessus]